MANANGNQLVEAAIATAGGEDNIPLGQEPWLHQPGVRDCLAKCRLPGVSIDSWIAEGYDDMLSFAQLSVPDVMRIGDRIQKLPLNRGGSRQPHRALKNIEKFVYWANNRIYMGQSVDSREFTSDQLDISQLAMEQVEASKEDQGTSVNKPEKFKPVKWVAWDKHFVLYLSTINSSVPEVSLGYVIRDESKRPADLNILSRGERLYWQVSKRTSKFHNQDNPRVYKLLEELLLDTDGYTWLGPANKNNGAAAYQSLRNHYNGQNQKDTRIAQAKRVLETLYYKGESTRVNFETFCTRVKENFEILEDNGVVRLQTEKVDHLLKAIQDSAPPYIKTAKTQVQMDAQLRNDFLLTISQMSQLVALNAPSPRATIQGPPGRQVSDLKSGGKRGRGGTGNHGVDVSDPTRNFTNDEVSTLRKAGAWRDVMRARAEARGARKKGGGSGRGRGGRGGDGGRGGGGRGGRQNDLFARVAALEGTLQSANDSLSRLTDGRSIPTHVNTPAPAPAPAPAAPATNPASNASGFGAGAYRGSGRGGGRIGSYTTGPRFPAPTPKGPTTVMAAATVSDTETTLELTKPNTTARMESDSHADTCIAGSNMLLLADTGLECQVHGFHDDLAPIKGVPIVTAVTAYDDDVTGETYMLIFNQALWFGPTMETSLIATHQVRSNGINLSDDPFDKGRPFGITDPDTKAHIPFTMEGAFAGALTRCPTWEEFNDNPNHIYMTDDAGWDPSRPGGAQVPE